MNAVHAIAEPSRRFGKMVKAECVEACVARNGLESAANVSTRVHGCILNQQTLRTKGHFEHLNKSHVQRLLRNDELHSQRVRMWLGLLRMQGYKRVTVVADQLNTHMSMHLVSSIVLTVRCLRLVTTLYAFEWLDAGPCDQADR